MRSVLVIVATLKGVQCGQNNNKNIVKLKNNFEESVIKLNKMRNWKILTKWFSELQLEMECWKKMYWKLIKYLHGYSVVLCKRKVVEVK